MNKFLIVSSHPTYYRDPIFRKLNSNDNLEVTVGYCTKLGLKSQYDKQFGRKVNMKIPLLKGYNYKFFKNYSINPGNSFFGRINFSVIDEIFSQHYDAVMIQGWNSLTNWLTIISCLVNKTPIIVRSESPLNQETKKLNWKLKIKKILLGNFLFPKVSAFLYIGKQNKEFYKFYGVPKEKLFFTPYAVDNERFQRESKRLEQRKNEFKKKLNINKEDVVILFVGKLIDKKRPLDLLKSYKKLISKTNKKPHLIFVGDGNLREKLENYKYVNNLDKVHFVGFKDQKELPKYYKISDIFVLPSGEGETWGLVVNEAMNFNLPIIISNVPGSGFDLVKNKKNGFIFSCGDIKSLSNKLQVLVEDNKKRKMFGKKSFQIIQNYSYEKDVKGFLSSFKFIFNS